MLYVLFMFGCATFLYIEKCDGSEELGIVRSAPDTEYQEMTMVTEVTTVAAPSLTNQAFMPIVEENDDALDFPHSPITSRRAVMQLQRLSRENQRLMCTQQVMGDAIVALMDRSNAHGLTLGLLQNSQDSLSRSHEESIRVRRFQFELERDQRHGIFFQALHSQLGGIISQDYVARFGGIVTKPDSTELALSLVSGAISAIPFPGSGAVGSVFMVAANAGYQHHKENRRKMRQINLKSKENAEDILTRLAIGLTYVYKNQIPLIDPTAYEIFSKALVEITIELLSTHIIPGSNIVTFLLGVIPYYGQSNPDILLKGGEKVPLNALLRETGIITPDGQYFLPVMTRYKKNVVQRTWAHVKESFASGVMDDFGEVTIRKNYALLSFRLSPIALERAQDNIDIFIHPLDPNRHPYIAYLHQSEISNTPVELLEGTSFGKITDISTLTRDRIAVVDMEPLGQELIKIEARAKCLALTEDVPAEI